MSQSNSPNDPGYISMSEAPGGDLTFDDLFPPEGGNQPSAPQAAVQGTPPQPPQAPPAAEQPPADFIRTPDGRIVYHTAEEAIQGITHKDALIEHLRQELVSRTGVDPITQKPVAPPNQPQAPVNYREDPRQYYRDLVQAVEKRDEAGYANAQAKFVNDLLAPVAPILTDYSRQRAIRQVNSEIPGFDKFVDSPEFTKVLDAVPVLKEAIQIAETDLYQGQRLGELYKIAYFTASGQGRSTQPTQAQPVTPQNPPAVRPSIAPSTITPPQPAASSQNWTTDREARKQLIRDSEARGVLDFKF